MPNVVKDPGKPSGKEIEEHNATHLPYRSWCPICVRGRAVGIAHRKNREGRSESEFPHIVFDYCFMGREEEDETIAIQVMKDTRSKAWFAHVVPKKGIGHEHGVTMALEDILLMGYKKIILKCDNEPALKQVQHAVRDQREDETICENSPRGCSQSNGEAERAVRAVQEQVRVLMLALEGRIGIALPSNHPVVAWLVRHSADIMNRYSVGADGRTPYERIRGKVMRSEAVEFGELVHYKILRSKTGKQAKMDSRWEDSIYLGTEWSNGESIIGTSTGVIRVRGIRRQTEANRWNAKIVEKVQGFPWHLRQTEDDAPVARALPVPIADKVEPLSDPQPYLPRPVRVRIRRQDFEEHGFSAGCLGCRAMRASADPRPHTEACRRRMEAAIASTAEGKLRKQRADDRRNEYIVKISEPIADSRPCKRPTLESKPSEPLPTASAARNSGSPATEDMPMADNNDRANKRKREAGDDGDQDEHRTTLCMGLGEHSACKLFTGTVWDMRHHDFQDISSHSNVISQVCMRQPLMVLTNLGDSMRPLSRRLVKEIESIQRAAGRYYVREDDVRNTVWSNCEKLRTETQQLCREGSSFIESAHMGLQMHLYELGQICDNGVGIVCEEAVMDKKYWDDITGVSLNPKLVHEARLKELEEFRQKSVYKKVPLTRCFDKTGRPPISVRWVDINKGDDANPNYRSRLVARQMEKSGDLVDLFAATPPLEAKKMLFSMAATEHRDRQGRSVPLQLSFVDVVRAYFNADATPNMFVKLPEEDHLEGHCGELLKSMYGTKTAASNWEATYIQSMEALGFVRGKSSPCLFWHPRREK